MFEELYNLGTVVLAILALVVIGGKSLLKTTVSLVRMITGKEPPIEPDRRLRTIESYEVHYSRRIWLQYQLKLRAQHAPPDHVIGVGAHDRSLIESMSVYDREGETLYGRQCVFWADDGTELVPPDDAGLAVEISAQGRRLGGQRHVATLTEDGRD